MLADAANGQRIYVNLISSSAGHYVSRRPYVINLIEEVLNPMELRGERVIIEHDMGRIIGNTDIVETNEKDTIYYAQPNKLEVFSRFVKNKLPQPSPKLTIIAQQDAAGDYEVCDAWIGPSSPPFPGDEHATTASKDYWLTHALVHEAQPIQTKTVTKVCPY